MSAINKLFIEAMLVMFIIFGFCAVTSSVIADDGVFSIEPGDNLAESCSNDDCIPTFDEGDEDSPTIWRLDRLYNAGVFSPSEYRLFDGMIMRRIIRLETGDY